MLKYSDNVQQNQHLVVPVLEFYYPCQFGVYNGDYETQNCAGGAAAFMSGFVPADFDRYFTSLVVYLIAAGNAAGDTTQVIVVGGTEGEDCEGKAKTFNKTVTYVSGSTLAIDITADVNTMAALLEAGDIFGVTVNPTAAINTSFLGMRGKYSPRYPIQ